MTPDQFGVRTEAGHLLPKRVAAYREHLAATARLWDAGVLPGEELPEVRDRPNPVPYRIGHGSTARFTAHLRAGERPCQACQDAYDRWKFPLGRAKPYGFDQTW